MPIKVELTVTIQQQFQGPNQSATPGNEWEHSLLFEDSTFGVVNGVNTTNWTAQNWIDVVWSGRIPNTAGPTGAAGANGIAMGGLYPQGWMLQNISIRNGAALIEASGVNQASTRATPPGTTGTAPNPLMIDIRKTTTSRRRSGMVQVPCLLPGDVHPNGLYQLNAISLANSWDTWVKNMLSTGLPMALQSDPTKPPITVTGAKIGRHVGVRRTRISGV